MDTDESAPSTSAAAGTGTEPSAKKDGAKRKAPEPSSSTLSNLSRVTPAQLGVISFPASSSRYVPVRPVAPPCGALDRRGSDWRQDARALGRRRGWRDPPHEGHEEG